LRSSLLLQSSLNVLVVLVALPLLAVEDPITLIFMDTLTTEVLLLRAHQDCLSRQVASSIHDLPIQVQHAEPTTSAPPAFEMPRPSALLESAASAALVKRNYLQMVRAVMD